MVLLLRTLGVPAHLVNGFAGGRPNEIGGFLEVTRSDAHTWVEVRYARAGWVRYDPTPPDLRARPVPALSFSERVRQLASTVELWWFQRVVGFDRADQIHALKRAWLAWQAARQGERTASADAHAPRRSPEWHEALGRAAPWGAVALLAALGLGWRRRRSLGPGKLPADYARALRLLARRGLVRDPATTARAFAQTVSAQQPPAVATPFEALTEAYLAERFGGWVHPARGVSLAALRGALRRTRAPLSFRPGTRS
jgi:hypothetical protein